MLSCDTQGSPALGKFYIVTDGGWQVSFAVYECLIFSLLLTDNKHVFPGEILACGLGPQVAGIRDPKLEFQTSVHCRATMAC